MEKYPLAVTGTDLSLQTIRGLIEAPEKEDASCGS